MHLNKPQPLPKPAHLKSKNSQYLTNFTIFFSMPFESWQLLWTLKALNISSQGLLCRFDITDASTQQKSEDFETLIEAQPIGYVQINPNSETYFCPTLPARIIQTTRYASHLELNFEFLNSQDDIQSLLMTLINETQDKRHTFNS